MRLTCEAWHRCRHAGIAFTSSMIRPQPVRPSARAARRCAQVPDRGYRFEKIFTDGVFMAGGVLEAGRGLQVVADRPDPCQAVQGAETEPRQLLRASVYGRLR